MRLDKLISNNKNISRKDTSKIIRKGNVEVNEQIICDPSFHVNENDKVIIFGVEQVENKKIYIALNKPKNYVCSTSNVDGENILNLIDENYIKGLHIVGRLDKDTTGLILLTNDGQFTHKIKNGIEKEYVVTLKENFTSQMNDFFKQEIKMDGKILKPFKISNIKNNTLNITLTEGRYHQIKRLFQMVDNPVIELKRIRIGNLELKKLKINEGEYTYIDNPLVIF